MVISDGSSGIKGDLNVLLGDTFGNWGVYKVSQGVLSLDPRSKVP